jgi:fructose-1,6-bisphosphatase/inositol monophosphatase family enzyme
MDSLEAALATLLLKLGREVRQQVTTARENNDELSAVSGISRSDTIFLIDRRVEPTIIRHLSSWPSELRPVGLFCEGFDEAPIILGGSGAPVVWLLMDPIDGTRCLMHDKRSAWFLAAAALGEVGQPKLSDAIVSIAVELPVQKQHLADEFVWTRSRGLAATRGNIGGALAPIVLRPSKAATLDHGFGTFVTYFPFHRGRAAQAVERLNELTGSEFFDDQYLSSAGQMLELAMGRDRFVVDLRAAWNKIDGQSRAPAPYPYDLAAAPIAKCAGVILTDAEGRPLDFDFSVDKPVSWCGYANEDIRGIVEPVVLSALTSEET